MRASWLLFAFWAALLFAAPAVGGDAPPVPCVLCAGAKSIACPTCQGKGRTTQTCPWCVATPKFCPARGDGGNPLHPGTRRECPNKLCRQGTIVWEDGKTSRCGLCGGSGFVPCGECLLLQTPCAVCSGRAKIDVRCLDCAGTGKLACLVCMKAGEKCRACQGAEHLACPLCGADGKVLRPCGACLGRGAKVCEWCLGAGRALCATCDGTGRYRAAYDDKTNAASKHCPRCDGKGAFPCEQGADGRAKCAACGDARRVPVACEACGMSHRLRCRVCDDEAFAAPEAMAETLCRAPAGDAALETARLLYERARFIGGTAAARHAVAATINPSEELRGVPGLPSFDAGWDAWTASIRAGRPALDAALGRLYAREVFDAKTSAFLDAARRIDRALAGLRSAAPASPTDAPPAVK